MRTDAEIVQIAHLVLAVDDGEASEDELKQALDMVTDVADNSATMLAVMLAEKLIEGNRYAISTDNPETVDRTVASVEESDGRTSITFAPPPRQ
jgi:hypothetical protein